MRTRRLVIVGCVVAALGVTVAAASLLPVTSARLGSGNTAVSACDTDGVTVTYTNSFDTAVADYRTTAVAVSNINAACTGKTLNVTVRSSGGSALWQGSTTISTTSATLAATPFVSSAIAGYAVAITG